MRTQLAHTSDLKAIARLIRYHIITATTHAGSGHPTSSLSAVELMTALCFGGVFRFDADDPNAPNNDRLIFSKGHASPLFYALWVAAGRISQDELLTLRTFGSRLEGHPTPAFPFTEAATGSLGQGLSVGVGMAINAKYLDKLPYKTYVLLGDSEVAEGSIAEAMQIAAHYKLNNLIGILDANRQGQRGETMYGHDLSRYKKIAAAYGWEPIVVNGHAIPAILSAYRAAANSREKPVLIIARTYKGAGVSFLKDKPGWHGKALSKEDATRALLEIGPVDTKLRGAIASSNPISPKMESPVASEPVSIDPVSPMATRRAYGVALATLGATYPTVVALDAEVSNSTFTDIFARKYPHRFFEMYIAEQNMIGTALGLSRRGKIPFVSTFAAFFTRGFDQIRMAQYSDANIKFVGSHAGISIGEDGASQMGLEDIAMFRTIQKSVILYPADAISTAKLVDAAINHWGIVYIRTTRKDLPALYDANEAFPIGGMKVLKKSKRDVATVIASGITLHEAIAAHAALKKEGISVRVIDLYSVKPIDVPLLLRSIRDTAFVLTVEDHYSEGGIGEAVRSALGDTAIPVSSLAVRVLPKSGKPEELIDYAEISSTAIIEKLRSLISTR